MAERAVAVVSLPATLYIRMSTHVRRNGSRRLTQSPTHARQAEYLRSRTGHGSPRSGS